MYDIVRHGTRAAADETDAARWAGRMPERRCTKHRRNTMPVSESRCRLFACLLEPWRYAARPPRTARQLADAACDRQALVAQSVRTVAPGFRQRLLADRLTGEQVHAIVSAFEAGTPRWQLAECYGISVRSVGRLLRHSVSVTIRLESAGDMLNQIMLAVTSLGVRGLLGAFAKAVLDKRQLKFSKVFEYKEARYKVIMVLMWVAMNPEEHELKLLSMRRPELNSVEKLGRELEFEYHNAMLYASRRVLKKIQSLLGRQEPGELASSNAGDEERPVSLIIPA